MEAIAIDREEFLEIQLLAVAPAEQGTGIGRHVMNRVCEEADRRGVILGISPQGATPDYTKRLEAWAGRLGFSSNSDAERYPIGWLRKPAFRRREETGVK